MIKILRTFKQFQISKIIQPHDIKPIAIDFFSLVFAKHELMSKTLKVTSKDAEKAFSTIIDNKECNIYLALHKNTVSLNNIKDIYGGILTIDLACYMKLDFSNVPVVSYPIAKIIQEVSYKLNELYPNPNDTAGKILHISALAVSELYANQGLGTVLYQTALYEGKKAGYKIAYNEATSLKSQNFQIKMGAKVLKEAKYKNFKYRDDYPFKEINDSESIQLLEINLTEL
jgi:hypothetical protein